MALPVPAKVFLKVSPGTIMLFSQPACAQEERKAHPVLAKAFLKVSPHMHIV